MEYGEVPANATLKLHTFKALASQAELDRLRDLLQLATFGPETFENSQHDSQFGISRPWLMNAVEKWKTDYKWRKTEERINSFPNYLVSIEDSARESYDIHFVALFSKRVDAIPIVMLHGWPGSFLEFLPVLDILKTKYSPSTLPYHIIVPSLLVNMAEVVNNLMVGLGFKNGYISQGGDIGSYISRILATKYSACKAVHLNFCGMATQPEGVDKSKVSEAEQNDLKRLQHHMATSIAYALEQADQPSTIGLVLSSSPIALLAWVGEKFMSWTEYGLSLDDILDSVTLYWLTGTISRSLFPYRDAKVNGAYHGVREYFIDKPLGFSVFPFEIMPVPTAWVKASGNLVWHRQHSRGGHFAAIEEPALFIQDVEDFVALVWQ